MTELEQQRMQELIRRLYAYYQAHPDELPEEYRALAERFSVDRAFCGPEYIRDMNGRKFRSCSFCCEYRGRKDRLGQDHYRSQ